MDALEHTFAERWWHSRDGLRLFARDYAPADGTAHCPVICLHGLTRNSADFEDLAPWLAAQGRRVLVPDMRGRGRSAYDANSANYKPLTYVQDVIALCAQLGIARALFIGTSMGGIITMSLALLQPKLIAAAVLNDVGPRISPAGIARIAGYVGGGQALDSWDAAAAYCAGINGAAFPNNTQEDWLSFARRTFAQDEQGRMVLQYDPGIAKPLSKGKLKSSSLLAQWAFRRLARRRPTLLVRGALSDIIEAEQAAQMRAAAPRMHYAEVDQVGHAPMLTEPQSLQALQAFLALAP